MDKLEVAKRVIKSNIGDFECGIFNTRNFVDDFMSPVYDEGDGLVIDGCHEWGYFEVFGLSDDEFRELEKFYDSLIKEMRGM